MSSSSENSKTSLYIEAFIHFFETNQKENYSLLEFYNQNKKFLIENTTQWDVKGVWKKRFKEAAKQLDIVLAKNYLEPDWENVRRLVFETIVKNDETKPTEEALKKRKSSSTQSLSDTITTSSSSSSKTVRSLSSSNYETLHETFTTMNESKKWKLADGVYAENILYEYAKASRKENMAHSFIINLKDTNLKGKYGDYWYQIISENKSALPKLPDNLSAYLEKVAELKSYQEIEKEEIPSYYQKKDQNISALCLKLVLSTYRNGFFSRSNILENDIMVNIWTIVDQVMNSYGIIAKRGEPCSVSSAARRNKKRNGENIVRKKIGRRNDLIICSNSGRELGCGEAGLEAEDFDTKVLLESSLKMPKMMHDMFLRLCKEVENNEKEVRRLKVVGLLFSRFKLSMLVMDCPKGYLCRLRSTKTVVFSGKEESLGFEFSKVYQLLWKAKEICRNTDRTVGDYIQALEIEYESEIDNDDKICPPHSLQSPERN